MWMYTPAIKMYNNKTQCWISVFIFASINILDYTLLLYLSYSVSLNITVNTFVRILDVVIKVCGHISKLHVFDIPSFLRCISYRVSSLRFYNLYLN